LIDPLTFDVAASSAMANPDAAPKVTPSEMASVIPGASGIVRNLRIMPATLRRFFISRPLDTAAARSV
jgi:hypothetical protein